MAVGERARSIVGPGEMELPARLSHGAERWVEEIW